MKTPIKPIAFFSALIMLTISCQPEVIEWQTKTNNQVITDYVLDNEETFSEFAEALAYTGIENILRVRGPFTLFLPTDSAMQEYYASKGIASITELDVEAASDFVYNHMCQGEITSGAIGQGSLPFLNGLGDKIASDLVGIDILLNKEAIVINRDVPVSNGMVHHLDHVLEPITMTVIDVMEAVGGYSIFLEGLNRVGYTDTLESVEFPYGQTTAKSNYTVLAVPDTLYNREGISSVDDLIDLFSSGGDLSDPDNGFRQYMAYHCISGAHYFTDFLPDDIYYIISGDNYLNIKVEEDFKINKTDSSYVGFYYELSNFPAKNGVIHAVNHTLPITETAPVEITHQVTDYWDLQQGSFYLNYYERFFDGQNTFKDIKWEGTTVLYYLKPGHHLMDDDAIKMEETHYWIEITTPIVRKGEYHLSGFFFQGGDRGVYACEVDGEYIGIVNPNEGAWGGDPVPFGNVSFETTESHKIKLSTVIPGRGFWDYVRFTPIGQ